MKPNLKLFLILLMIVSVSFTSIGASCGGKKVDAPNAFNALREAYEPLPKVYTALLDAKVITVKQYNEVIVPADKILYLGIQGGFIAVDTAGVNDLSEYKAKIREGLDLLDTIQNEKLQAATSVIRVLLEGL